MKAVEANLLAFLKKSPQFIIPIYQRAYSWTEKECRQLWGDVIRSGADDSIKVHFIGSIVYIQQGLTSAVSHQSPLLVIDGQQRLTTVTLLIAALAESLNDGEPEDGFSARKLRNYYLLNPDESGERHYKLLLSQTDKSTLTALVSGAEPPPGVSLRVSENIATFRDLLAALNGNFHTVCKGLAKLVVVDIALTRGEDDPQLIFESMNSTGRELSQADLIRNYVLMGLDPKLQTRLYERYWRPMETDFGQEAYSSHFDGFMRHYLTMKTGDIPNLGAVYEAFKTYAKPLAAAAGGVEELVKDLRGFAHSYCAMALGSETDEDLRNAFLDLRELRVDVAFPLLLELYHDYEADRLPKGDFVKALRLIESYVFRRAICAIPTNSMNKTFATFARTLKKDRYLESLLASFLALRSYRRFPSDDEFRRDLQTRDLYNFPRRSYWLRRLENHDRKERVQVTEYTIEHILPQNEHLSAAWRDALGTDWERVQQTWLHTLGNLTLTRYNSEYSDLPFTEKRDQENGFRHSPLKLNAGLGQLDQWDETAIKTRAGRLADTAVTVWSSPHLSGDILAAYRTKTTTPGVYTLDDHPHLQSRAIREVFDAFRIEVLALDPCVTEEILKLYVAYKAETNFVDVVPQAKRLRLSLNLAFTDIDDPKGRCKDVTGVGRWGNGDVEVGLTTLAELPYVMGLVRQAFERQMGPGQE